MTATSSITGHKINRFTHIHSSVEDLIKKVQMLRLIAHETASCFQRCVGFDAVNALYMTTFEMDEKHGTKYFQRLLKYLERLQDENFMLVGGMTDPKATAPRGQASRPTPIFIPGSSRKGMTAS